jgi:hypothetical protein
MNRVACVLLLFTVAGCGALFNSGPANIPMSTNPPGAEVWIDGTSRGVTPLTLPLAKNRNHTVTLRKDGFEDTTVEIGRKVSAGYVILDILGGVLPVVVDAATGSWYVLDTNNVNVNMRDRTTALHGQLTAEQLAAVRLGAGIDQFVEAPEGLTPRR